MAGRGKGFRIRGMDSDSNNTSELLRELVAYERNRPPTERELKKYKDFNGVAPHLRPGPLHSMYPDLTVEEILSTRAIIAHLLCAEYGLSVADVSGVLRCDNEYVERLLPVGAELAVDSAVVGRMKDIVKRVARMIVTMAQPQEEAAQVKRMLRQFSGKPRKAKPKVSRARSDLSTADTAQVRCFIVHMLAQEFHFKAANIRPLFEYPTREQIRSMQCKSERFIHRWSSISMPDQ